MKRGGYLRPMSKKRVKGLGQRRKIREAVFYRDQTCQLSPFGNRNWEGQHWGPCFGEMTVHHLVKASQGGEYTLDNLVTMCAGHNDMIEDYPVAAKRMGLSYTSATERDLYEGKCKHDQGVFIDGLMRFCAECDEPEAR